MSALKIDDIRVLEDLIIEAIYDGLLKGKLDQRASVFKVVEVVARDIQLHELDGIIGSLNELQASAEYLHCCLQNSSATIRDQRNRDHQDLLQLQARFVAVKAYLKVNA
jgi:COP9 signalosome complex subunit 7